MIELPTCIKGLLFKGSPMWPACCASPLIAPLPIILEMLLLSLTERKVLSHKKKVFTCARFIGAQTSSFLRLRTSQNRSRESSILSCHVQSLWFLLHCLTFSRYIIPFDYRLVQSHLADWFISVRNYSNVSVFTHEWCFPFEPILELCIVGYLFVDDLTDSSELFVCFGH